MSRPPPPPPPPYSGSEKAWRDQLGQSWVQYGGGRNQGKSFGMMDFDAEVSRIHRRRLRQRAVNLLSWIGTALQVVGVFLMAGRLAEPAVAYAVMLVGSMSWSVAAAARRELAMMVLNVTFVASNIVGIWRWAS